MQGNLTSKKLRGVRAELRVSSHDMSASLVFCGLRAFAVCISSQHGDTSVRLCGATLLCSRPDYSLVH